MMFTGSSMNQSTVCRPMPFCASFAQECNCNVNGVTTAVVALFVGILAIITRILVLAAAAILLLLVQEIPDSRW